MKSFDDYKGVLPYASELFGIYQPLLGWKSRIIQRRYDFGSAPRSMASLPTGFSRGCARRSR